MQVSIETTTGLERRMTVTVPATEIDSAVDARLSEAAKTVRINGFRKGKVPMKVIRNRFGAGVRQEVLGDVMNRSYYAALNEQGVKPAGQPKIEPKTLEEGKDLEFVAVFEVYPEIELSDFSKIKAEKQVAEVTDKDIDTMIENLRQQRQGWKEVKRQARNDDRVNIDFVGTIDGEEFQGGSAKGTNLVLGSGRMIEGFEKGLLKSKAGDEVTLNLNFPEDYRNKDLAGKPVEFKVTVNSVEAPELPELNDEFFAAFGVTEGGEEGFRKEVKENMERELKKASKNRLKSEVMDTLLEQNDVDVPSALVAAEINVLRQQALQQFGAGAKNLDASLLPDDLFREQAEKRVKLGLILGEVIKQQSMRADPAKVREAIEDIAATYEQPEEVINWYYGNKEQLETVESAVLEDQVFDVILEQATVKEKKVSYDELTKPQQEAAEDDKKSTAKAKKPAKKKAAAAKDKDSE
ncbi:MAG: trigger factor [Gammaproteobacteria bacterium]|nr:trigger factor [Gammaproteobacteria bacterium]MBJ56016.1 trigger factor [Gammaproteobacteria bacterium]HBN13452.1 trigger factor [Pseudohongiella sp.]|tara:strand:+ start:196 stop:1590 length:1395 start_codon:yes stop_codon:yes gene_type:complete